MKLATILRRGEARPALVITNAGLRAKWCLDLSEANTMLNSAGREWPVQLAPPSVRQIVEGGMPALDNLKRWQDVLLSAIDRSDGEAFGPALVPPEEVCWLPPIPNCPLFITFHGNSIGIWRDRGGGLELPQSMPARAILSRVPTCRLHPETATLGHMEPLIFSRGQPFGFGNELGVVLAPGGKNISYDDGMAHVWGITNCDDVTRSTVWPTHFGSSLNQMPRHEGDSRARLGRASDASCPTGPWITTIDEVPNVLDLLMYAAGPDGSYDRAHTWSYIMAPHNAIAYLSRFMTLPAGTTLQLGAAGLDGISRFDDPEPIHGQHLEVSMERVGTLSNPIWCEERSGVPRATGEGFYRSITRHRGLDTAEAFCSEEQPFPRGTRSIWAVRHNDRYSAEEPAYSRAHQRQYETFPRHSLASGQAVEIPVHADRIDVSCELAAVIGTQPIARVAAEDVPALLAGVTVMVGMRDSGLLTELTAPTDWEAFDAGLLGRWGDGFNSVSPEIVSVAEAGDLNNLEMRVTLTGMGQAVTRSADYLMDLNEVIAFITKEITLLPGDVVSLGCAGRFLELPKGQKLSEGATLEASIEGIGELSVPLIDKRGPHPPLYEVV